MSRTTAVGMYPNGSTQQGVLDLAGNVWEWCLNTYEQPEHAGAVRISDDPGNSRVLRGGSWNNKPGNLRSSDRDWNLADNRDNFIGFRLVQDIP